MPERFFRTIRLLCVLGAVLQAATPGRPLVRQQDFTFDYPLPDGTVGVAYTEYLLGELEGLESVPGVGFSFSFSVTGGSLPPGLSLRPNGLVTGTPTAAGKYNFTFRLTLTITADGQRFDFNVNLLSGMEVTASTAPQIAVQPRGVFFPFVEGAAGAPQSISVANRGSQPATFTASATTFSGTGWLSVSPTSGTVPPFGAVTVTATANPTGLAAGTYSGRVNVALTPGGSFEIPVTVTVSGSRQSLLLSQTGLFFRAGVGGAAPAQSFSVLNEGAGTLNWTLAASTLSGGPNWLSVTPTSGSSAAGAGQPVQASINLAGLAPGDYYGQIQVTAPSSANSPQFVSVVLSLLPADRSVPPAVSPAGFVFVGAPGGANPAVQAVVVTNTTGRPINFGAGTFFEGGRTFFTVRTTSGVVQPGAPVRIELQPTLAGIPAGVYRGELTLRLVEDRLVRRVDVVLVVAAGVVIRAGSMPVVAQGACTPTRLLPVFTQLGADFKVTAGWPTPLEVLVVDDCGNFANTGSVAANFSNNDPPVILAPLGGGRWSGTWQARDPNAARVTISVRARVQNLEGAAEIGGAVETNPSVPLIAAGGTVNAASFAPQSPLAPGSLVSIFGSRMAQATNVSATLPLATDLAGTRVVLGGRVVPLLFASDGQINAVIPFETAVNARHSLIVQRGASLSVPEPVTIAPAQPAVFTNPPGRGIIAVFTADGRSFLATPGSPAAAGDVLVIYCTGLGAVNPAVQAGTAAPSSPLSQTANPVTVTVGGRPAQVAFSGLSPGFAGLYQVNAVMPEGVVAGDQVPVVLTAAGQTSTPVAIAVR